MKNGFTLVELLAILVLLGVIILVAVPSVIESNRMAKENEKAEYEEAVKTACESYAAVKGSSSGVSVGTLVRDGYLKKDIDKHKGDSSVSGCS